jgi:hypothetical protein
MVKTNTVRTQNLKLRNQNEQEKALALGEPSMVEVPGSSSWKIQGEIYMVGDLQIFYQSLKC